MYGQRRIGKSSVLQQIPNFITRDKFLFVLFDLQDKSQQSLSCILHNLAIAVLAQTDIDENMVRAPTEDELENNLDLFDKIFLPKIYQKIDNKSLVFLLDEFDVLNNKNLDKKNNHLDLFLYLEKLFRQQKKLVFIPVIGRNVGDLPQLLHLFRDAPYQEIGFLDDLSARRLITKPAEKILTYEPDAIQTILRLSAGHPYITQVICFTIFNLARNQEKWVITSTDVEYIVYQAIENSQAGLAWFWDGLTIPEQVVFSSVAEAEMIAIRQGKRVPEDPLMLLQQNGISITDSLIQAVNQLVNTGFLDDTGRRITVELVRLWLVQFYPLRSEIWELEKEEEESIKHLTIVASSLRKQGKHQNAILLYEQALEFNPNNFKNVLSLAQEYLQVNNFENALELYKRLYQADPESYKEELLHALSLYGHHLIIKQEYTLAKKQYNQILEIKPNTELPRKRLSEIEAYEHTINNTLNIITPTQRPSQIHRGSTLVRILAVITVFGTVGYGTYQFSSDCPPGQQKEFGIACVADKSRISNGDRTLFPNLKNINRDLGIKAFKHENYKEAIKLFGQAVAANRNDPEVLIYYNNALARDKGNPFTLAAAVTNSDQEMLRGVAQAQHQFNQKNGLNGRLLEIQIANDADQPEQAKQVAAELVKDQSILGVIGHYSSESTKAALKEYNKTDIPIISPTSTSTQLQGRNFFRSLPDDAAGGKKLAEYAFNNLKLRKLVIFSNPDSSYSDSMREEFTKTFERLGGEVLRKPQINLADTSLDMNAEVYKSDEYKAQAAVLIPDAGHIDVALKIANINKEVVHRSQSQNTARPGLKLLGGDSLYSDYILSIGGNAVEGLIVVVPWFRGAPQATNFAQQAENQWGGGVSWRTATSYDATQAFIQALSANPNRTTILENLEKVNLSDHETSGYPLKFSPEGERETEPVLVQIKRGKFVAVPQ
ncbi:ABC transporter substrate-binding protein [Tolypothrix sp. VBCCA 56010]|uniref:ABC transporter substrate-binding protein n=1 Tax=Tolypothrix sp. VBCCA 56010 TaxID=3137731 RepID=UPI003D7D4EE4